MSPSTPAPHTLSRDLRVRAGARVIGRSGRPIRRLPGKGWSALECVRGKGLGVVKGVTLADTRDQADVWRGHLVTLQGGQWLLEDVAVYDAAHGGVYVDHGEVVIRDLKGEGCAWGELIARGTPLNLLVEGATIDHLNDEIETNNGRADRVYRRVDCKHLGIQTRPAEGSVVLDRVRVSESVHLASVVDLEATDCDWSSASLEIVQPGHSTFTRCKLPAGLVRSQTRWRRELDQRLSLFACHLAGPFTVRGIVEIVLSGTTVAEGWDRIVAIAAEWGKTSITIHDLDAATTTVLAAGEVYP